MAHPELAYHKAGVAFADQEAQDRDLVSLCADGIGATNEEFVDPFGEQPLLYRHSNWSASVAPVKKA